MPISSQSASVVNATLSGGRPIVAHVPLPLQIVIDDVGWWSGKDGHAEAQPYRTGISRHHVVADYAAIARLGAALNMRPQAALVLCEWDRDNLLRGVPTATWMGESWDNQRWVGPWLDEAAATVRDSQAHLEVALHAVGHEYWRDGLLSRAEWYDRDGLMRPYDQVMAHLDAWYAILRRNGLDVAVTSFVPAAFLYRHADGERGLASILRERGIGFVSTPFSTMRRGRVLDHALLAIDQGLVTVDRGDGPIPWDAIATEPPGQIGGPILGLHWPNILHLDPARNGEVVERWVAALRALGSRPNRILSRDTAAFVAQLAYHVGAELRLEGDQLICDLSRLRSLSPPGVGDTFTLTVRTPRSATLTSPDAQVVSRAYDEVSGWHTLELRVGASQRLARVSVRA